MRISDWSSDVCSSDLRRRLPSGYPRKRRNRPLIVDNIQDYRGAVNAGERQRIMEITFRRRPFPDPCRRDPFVPVRCGCHRPTYRLAVLRREIRSEEHMSELQSLMRISYAVFCLKKKIQTPI